MTVSKLADCLAFSFDENRQSPAKRSPPYLQINLLRRLVTFLLIHVLNRFLGEPKKR